MANPTPMRVQDTGGLFVAFVFTVALVLGIVCRTAIVSAVRATVPPVLGAIVLPAQPPARPEVAAAPPQPAPAPAPATAPASTASPVRTSVRTSTAPAVTVPAGPATTVAVLATVQVADVQPIVAVRTITDATDVTDTTTPARSLAGTTSPRSAAATPAGAGHGRNGSVKAKADDHPGPRPHRTGRAANGAHHDPPNHGNGGRRSGR